MAWDTGGGHFVGEMTVWYKATQCGLHGHSLGAHSLALLPLPMWTQGPLLAQRPTCKTAVPTVGTEGGVHFTRSEL